MNRFQGCCCVRQTAVLFGLLAAILNMALAPLDVAAAASTDGRQPNILLIITDQQQAAMMSCAGNRWVQTPALDRLAAAGVRFERAYAANPVCIPSRVSMITGHMPSHFGVRSNADGRNQAPAQAIDGAMGWIFRNAGYQTVYGGKTHWLRGMNPKSLGFDVLTADEREGLARAGARFLHAKHDKPFLLVASFINPHDICYMAIDAYTGSTGKPTMYPKSHVERQRLAAALKLPEGVSPDRFFQQLCPPLPANFEIPRLEPQCVAEQYVRARPFRQYVRGTWSERQWRLHRWAYCRLTEMVDAHIAKLVDALWDSGLAEQTVVVFTSDHGDMDASHRLEHKSVLYEEATNVPLIICQKGSTPPGLVDDVHLVSVGLDLIPTLCDFASVGPPPGLLGRSVRPLTRGQPAPPWRDQVAVESKAGRMLRTDRFKYVVYENGPHREQLIDLIQDPGEMTNLAEDSKFREVLGEHRARLRRWVEKSGDEIAKPYVPSGD